MTDDTDVLRVPGGRTLTIRPTTTDDVDGLLEMYASLSPEDRYRRFFSGSRPAQRVIERLVNAAEKGGEWLVAVSDDGTIVADVGYTALPDGDAELAITVTRPWRGWLGPYLLDLAARRAKANGITNLRADILVENQKMLTLAARRGCATVDHPDRNVIELTMSTSEGMPGWPPAHARHRLLIEGCSGRWRKESEARAEGWDVITCAGPGSRWVPGYPMLEGGHCSLVDDADVVVMAFPPGDPRRADLLEAHARLAPDVRIVMDEDAADIGLLSEAALDASVTARS